MAEYFVILVLVVLIMLPLVFHSWSERKKGNAEFDERQELLRGKAFQHAFLALGGYSGLYSMVVLFSERQFMEDGVSTIIGFFLGLIVFSVECVWRDAFFSTRSRPKSYILILAVNVVLGGVNGMEKVREGLVVRNGLLTMECISLACGITFFIVLVAIVARWLATRGEARE